MALTKRCYKINVRLYRHAWILYPTSCELKFGIRNKYVFSMTSISSSLRWLFENIPCNKQLSARHITDGTNAFMRYCNRHYIDNKPQKSHKTIITVQIFHDYWQCSIKRLRKFKRVCAFLEETLPERIIALSKSTIRVGQGLQSTTSPDVCGLHFASPVMRI